MVLHMLGVAGSYAREYVVPLLKEGVILIRGVPKEVDDLTKKRTNIQALISAADRAAEAAEAAKKAAEAAEVKAEKAAEAKAAEAEAAAVEAKAAAAAAEAAAAAAAAAAAKYGNKRKEIIEWATKLRKIDFRIEDIIDEWNTCRLFESVNGKENDQAVYEEQPCCDRGCVALPCDSANNIINIKCYDRLLIALEIQKIKSDLDKIQEGSEIDEGQSSSASDVNPDDNWMNLGRIPIYNDQTEIVGFETASGELIGWLEDKRAECTVMVLVGMAGQGKTTLAQEIFNNKKVMGKFTCSAWLNVSDFDAPDKFFRSMLLKLYPQTGEPLPPDGFSEMGPVSLKNEVKKYLRTKRYVLFFDDVWNKKFWQEIGHTVSNNGNGSRIIVTTRNQEVARTFHEPTIVEVQPLTEEESLKLFRQSHTAFKYGSNKGRFPKTIERLSSDVVRRCGGLPLGIVAIGKHLSAYKKHAVEWKSKIEEAGITGILCLSFENLPQHLKPCLLYFGIFPQDYEVKSKRLMRQWIAEGFVKYDPKRIFEDVAEDYLTSLIDRNLVQATSVTIDGKPKSCRVHYLVHDMILRKFKDLCFCRCINEDDEPEPESDISGMITRRLSIATNCDEELPGFFNGLADKIESPFLRSLHFFTEETPLPADFAKRIPVKKRPLRVVDFEDSRLSHVPEDLGNLIHLKYLSFRNTSILSLPKSIGELQNLETLDLRGTAVNEMPKEVSKLRKLRHLLGLVQLKDGIVGGMKFLKTLRGVKIDDDGAGLIENELGKLWQLRDLRLTNVGEEHGSALCSAINKMKHLEKLHIVAKSGNRVIALQGLKKPSMIQKLRLEAYECESLHFQEGDFENLEDLELRSLHSLSSITIHSKALPSLTKLELRDIPRLETVPPGIQHLEELEYLNIQICQLILSREFLVGGQGHPIIKHVPRVRINGELVKY